MIWVHVFEEDGPAGEVYRPEGDDIPLSRRPRERLELRPDGSASVFLPGPDDRFIEQQASWEERREQKVITLVGGGLELIVTEQSSSRMVIRRRQASDKG